jgi:hypothetical protein
MTVFPTAKHLASWAGMCPGNDESAGKRRSGKTRKGSKWLGQALVECAKTANRTKNTYLAAQYARLRARRGANKATIAVCHSILTAAWHMLQTGQTYTDPGGDFFARRDPERTRKRSSASSNASATPSRFRKGPRQPKRDFLYRGSPTRRAYDGVPRCCRPSQAGIFPGFSMTALTMPLARRSGASRSVPSGISPTCERPLRRLIRASSALRSRCPGMSSAPMRAWSRGRMVGRRSVTSVPHEGQRLCSTTILSSNLLPSSVANRSRAAQPKVKRSQLGSMTFDAANRFSGSAIAADSRPGSRDTRSIHSSTRVRGNEASETWKTSTLPTLSRMTTTGERFGAIQKRWVATRSSRNSPSPTASAAARRSSS